MKNGFLENLLISLDISILPFIRQFRIANPEWFDMQNQFLIVKRFYITFLESKLFNEIMINYDVWEEGSKPEYFPIFNYCLRYYKPIESYDIAIFSMQLCKPQF